MCEGILHRITVFITTKNWKHPKRANVGYLVSKLCSVTTMEHGSQRHRKQKE